MRGTAAVLVCLISLHYFSVIDAYSSRFTSENGMPGREHEDKHPRKSTGVRRSLPPLPFRSLRKDTETFQEYYDTDEEDGIPYENRNRNTDTNTNTSNDTITDTNDISKNLEQIIDLVAQLFGKVDGKPSEPAGGEPAGVDTKRKNARVVASKKRAMTVRDYRANEPAVPTGETIIGYLSYSMDMAKKALDFALDIMGGLDVTKLSDNDKEMKGAIMEMLKSTKDGLEELADSIIHGIDSGGELVPERRARSVIKRMNTGDAPGAYLASLRSKKRSKLRQSLRGGSTKRNIPAKGSEMAMLTSLMSKMEDCVKQMPAQNLSLGGMECIILPMLEVWGSPDASRSAAAADSSARSNKFKPYRNPGTFRGNLHGNNIFLIPIYDNLPSFPNTNTTTSTTATAITTTTHSYPEYTIATIYDPASENITTTTKEPTTTSTTEPTTTSTTSTTTEFHYPGIWPDPGFNGHVGESHPSPAPGKVPGDSRYRSKYDNDF